MTHPDFDMQPRAPRGILRWSDAVIDLSDLLAQGGAPAYIVGGAVRDALLGYPIKDIDIAVAGSGMALARLIANRMGGKYYALDSERDVGRAIVEAREGRLEIDVARLRGADLAADLLDRDFTMNAMAVDVREVALLDDPYGRENGFAPELPHVCRLIDPLGGETDMIAKIIRRCSPGAIPSDPIRALRAVRQSIQFKLRIEADTLADVRATGERLLNTSAERVRDEFFKLLALSKASSALRIAERVGLLRVIVPEIERLQAAGRWESSLAALEHLGGIISAISPARTDETAAKFSYGMMVMALDRFRGELQAHLAADWADERSHRALLNFAALLPPLPDFDMAAALDQRALALRLSNHERARLTAVAAQRLPSLALPDSSPVEMHRFWYPLRASGVDVCLLALADYLAAAGVSLHQDDWLVFVEQIQSLLDAYYNHHDEIVDPPLVIDGTALMKSLHLKPGRLIGELLVRIREAQVTGEVASGEDALALARRHIADS